MRVCVEGVLDLTRPDFLACDVDHVLLPVRDIEPAILVYYRDVACEELAVVEGFLGLLRLVPIASEDHRFPGRKLAGLPDWDLF